MVVAMVTVCILVFVVVELVYGTLYCLHCKDHIYDSDIDQITREVDQQMSKQPFQCESASKSVIVLLLLFYSSSRGVKGLDRWSLTLPGNQLKRRWNYFGRIPNAGN